MAKKLRLWPQSLIKTDPVSHYWVSHVIKRVLIIMFHDGYDMEQREEAREVLALLHQNHTLPVTGETLTDAEYDNFVSMYYRLRRIAPDLYDRDVDAFVL